MELGSTRGGNAGFAQIGGGALDVSFGWGRICDCTDSSVGFTGFVFDVRLEESTEGCDVFGSKLGLAANQMIMHGTKFREGEVDVVDG